MANETAKSDATKTAIDAGAAIGQPVLDDDGRLAYAVVPDGYKIADLERFLGAPRRNDGETVLGDDESFIAYVAAHRTPSLELYCDPRKASFLAVFNPGGHESPAWGDERASFAAVKTREFVAWEQLAASKQFVDQAAFAEFVEDHLGDFAEPRGADVLEIARHLQATRSIAYSSGISLANGSVQFAFDEQVQAASRRGQIEVPERFTIVLRVFEGGGIVGQTLSCRLRWRIGADKRLTFRVDIPLLQEVVDDAFDTIREKIGASIETTIPILTGTPSTRAARRT